ncbi:sugar/nucleoside kinase (ribokinase family) [Catenuloplanes nepalensis]|uniref:Sugar/nucleoside kinase (Ribokinase family) n=1 Tax=Catenuloplanes nepalensis TaxID=587533 RepID=A0ABT9MZU8_9ACTN|nr:carbohydrate kinase family protein [Catenuloplanes nepalensis]MDP9796973.1 sugar/nucleoside kinase (ribokinase family) [Catenuloplanes nepalensis]
MTRILVVGDVITDVVAVLGGPFAPGSDTPATIRVAGGGQAANTAAWLAAAGVPVTLAGVAGDDQAGDTRLAELSAAGVTTAVRRAAGAVTGTIIVLSAGGERSMITERGANLLLRPADVDAARTPDVTRLHLSGYALLSEATRPAARHALRQNAATSVDAASAEPLRQVGAQAFLSWVRGCDLLLANADEAAVLAGPGRPDEQARTLAAATGGTAVVKRGAAGAIWASADGSLTELPPSLAASVTPVDPTGAGDAFAAGLLAALLHGASPMNALAAAHALGARAVTTIGARPPGR